MKIVVMTHVMCGGWNLSQIVRILKDLTP